MAMQHNDEGRNPDGFQERAGWHLWSSSWKREGKIVLKGYTSHQAGIGFRPSLLFPGFNALRYAVLSFPFDYFRDASEAERVKNSRLSERSEFLEFSGQTGSGPLKKNRGAHFLGSVLLGVQKNEPGEGGAPFNRITPQVSSHICGTWKVY